jgi:hypothetical protein
MSARAPPDYDGCICAQLLSDNNVLQSQRTLLMVYDVKERD